MEEVNYKENKSKYMGLFYVICATFLFSLISIVAKKLYEAGLNEKNITTISCFVSAIFSLIYNLLFNKSKILVDKKNIVPIIFQGIFGSAITTLFFYKSLYLIDAAICVMLFFTNPVFVFLYYMIVKKEKFNKKAIFSLFITMFGIFMVIDLFGVSGIKLNKMGIIYAIIASLSYAYTSINVQENLSKEDPFILTMYTNIIAGVILLFIYNPAIVFDFDVNIKTVFGLLELGTVSGLLPMVLIYTAIRKIGAYKTSLIGTLELPITAILGFVILKESLSMFQIIGISLVFFGVINVER